MAIIATAPIVKMAGRNGQIFISKQRAGQRTLVRGRYGKLLMQASREPVLYEN